MRSRGLLALVLLLAVAGAACGRRQPEAAGPVPAAVAPAVAAAVAAPRHLTLVAVGDVMLDRNVGGRIKAAGCASIVEAVAPELQAGDLTFANLESPLASTGAHDPPNCVFRADPRTVKVLTLGGVDVVSLANNHTLDPGREALLETMKCLDQAGIRYCGAAREKSQSSWPRVLEAQGLRVAFMAFTDLDFEHGSWSRVPQALAAHQALIRSAKNKCDLLVVSYHWGTEYAEKPTQRQREVAHAAIEAGADVILGHHPHVLEGVEFYQGRPVLYSLGNFVFDQRPGPRMESALFRLEYTEGEGWSVAARPVVIPRERLAPQWATGERGGAILQRLAGYCRALGTGAAVSKDTGELRLTPGAPQTGASAPQTKQKG